MADIKFLNEVGATVVINGVEQEKVTVDAGSKVTWEVSKTGYVTQSGSQEVWEDTVLPVVLKREEYTITFNVSPTDATLTVNGSAVALTDGKYTMTAKWGDTVSWSCGAVGYIGQNGNFTATEDRTVNITLEAEAVVNPDRTIKFVVSPTDATLTVNGSEVTLSGGTYTMTAHDGDVIEWSCEKDSYIQQSGSHTVNGNATLEITLEAEVVENPYRTITFIVSPTDSTIEVNGFIYQQDVDTGILEMRVKYGTVLEWSVYKDNYVTQSGYHTVEGDDTIEVTLESSSSGVLPPVSGGDSNITFDPEHPDNGATFKMTVEGLLATLFAWIAGYTPAQGEQVVFDIDGTSYTLYGEDNKATISTGVGEHTCSVTHSYTSVSSLSYPYKLCVSLSGTTYELSVGTNTSGGVLNSDTQPSGDTEAYSEGEKGDELELTGE